MSVTGFNAPFGFATARGLPRAVLSLAIVLAAASVLFVVAKPARAAALRPPALAYRSAADGLLYEWGPDGQPLMVANGLGVAPGTSAAVAPLSTGGRAIAFQAAGSGNLWYVDADNIGHDAGVRVAAGTSPAIVALPGGVFTIVFTRADDGLLWERSPNGSFFFAANGLGMAPGTSPAIAALPTGGFAIAFQAAGSGNLWYVDQNNVGHDTGWPVAAGSSPAIAGLPNGFTIVFRRAADGLLWERSVNGSFFYAGAGFGIAPGTSPDVVALATGGFAIAFHASGADTLWYVDANNVGHNTGIRMGPNTSPTLTAGWYGWWQAAFQDDTHHLLIVDNTNQVYDPHLDLAPGSTPDAPPTLGGAPTLLLGKTTFTQAPSCSCTAPTAALTSLANITRVRTRNVTTIVTVPAGLPVTNLTEIHVQGYGGGSAIQNYNPTTGNKITLQFAESTGVAREEHVDITFIEHATKGTVSFPYLVTVPIQPHYNVAISPLSFHLINDCDYTLGVFVEDSEVKIRWADDRPDIQEAGFDDVRAFDMRQIPQFGRILTDVTVANNLLAPGIEFEETDPVADNFPGFTSWGAYPEGALLPGVSRHVHLEDHSRGQYTDEFCNAAFDYDVTITLLTYVDL